MLLRKNLPTNLPTLSVLLPNYNHAQFIGNALKAILAQTAQPMEIIIVDDGSTDESLTVIDSFARQHPMIRVLKNETNRGVNFSLNRALRAAQGEYIYGAAADDQVLPGFFERSLRLLASHPQAALCCSYPSRIDAVTGTVTQHALGWSDEECYLPPERLAEVMCGQGIAGHTSIARRDAFTAVGGWIDELRWFTDWYALQMLGLRHGVCFIPATLALFRSSLGSFYSAGVRNRELQFSAVSSLFRRLQSSECSDLMPLFRQSGVLSEIGLDAVRVLAAYPEHRTPLMLAMLRPALRHSGRRLLRDGTPAVRRGVAEMLGDLGPSAWRSLPALLSLRDDQNPQVARAAVEAAHKVLGAVDQFAGGTGGRMVAGTLRVANRTRRQLQSWLKPPVSWVYRTVNFKLYVHIDDVENSMRDCRQKTVEDQDLAAREIHALRRSVEDRLSYESKSDPESRHRAA